MYVFPEDWNVQKVQGKKKRKLDEEDTMEEDSGGLQHIVRNIQNTKEIPNVPQDLDLDSILSHISFENILSNFNHSSAPRVPIVSKVYEESFMREPYNDERPCASGSLCEGNFIDPTNPFTLVEFVPPGEPSSDHEALCVLCSRKITQKLFYDILFAGKESKACIQRYGNICNVPNEYARECMLICPPHAPLEVCLISVFDLGV